MNITGTGKGAFFTSDMRNTIKKIDLEMAGMVNPSVEFIGEGFEYDSANQVFRLKEDVKPITIEVTGVPEGQTITVQNIRFLDNADNLLFSKDVTLEEYVYEQAGGELIIDDILIGIDWYEKTKNQTQY